MRFLILCLLIYVGYRTLKALIVPHESSSRPETQDELTRVDDVMINVLSQAKRDQSGDQRRNLLFLQHGMPGQVPRAEQEAFKMTLRP
jgi:hypothetical protein